MNYRVCPTRTVVYVGGCVCEDVELTSVDANESEAEAFSVFEGKGDGHFHWIADFGNKRKAGQWIRTMLHLKQLKRLLKKRVRRNIRRVKGIKYNGGFGEHIK